MPRETTRAHLARLYAADPDPWGHLTRPYERAKYELPLMAVGAGPFRVGLEIGCGNGALAVRLAPLCAAFTGLEMIPAAVAQARTRLAGLPHVRVIEGTAPADLSELAPDLIVLSEVLYFLTPGEIDGLARWIGARARPECRVVAVNWSGPTGEALTGEDARLRLRNALGGWGGSAERYDGFTIDVLTAQGRAGRRGRLSR